MRSRDRHADAEVAGIVIMRWCRRELSYCGAQWFERNVSCYTLDPSVAEIDCHIIYRNWYGK
jgi:hypothetical protein